MHDDDETQQLQQLREQLEEAVTKARNLEAENAGLKKLLGHLEAENRHLQQALLQPH